MNASEGRMGGSARAPGRRRPWLERLRWVGPVFLCLMMLGSCVPRSKPTEAPRPEPGKDWMQLLERRLEGWPSYRAQYRIRVASPQGKHRVRALVCARLGDGLRIETSNSFGQVLGVLVATGEGAGLWVASEHTLYTAERGEVLAERLFGIRIDPQVLAHVLAGCVPRDQLAGDWRFTAGHQHWTGHAGTTGDGPALLWQFASPPLAMAGLRILGTGAAGEVSYAPPVPMEPDEAAKRIDITSDQIQLEAQLVGLERTPVLADSLFAPPAPPGTRLVEVDRAP